jgi:hypothetical protein
VTEPSQRPQQATPLAVQPDRLPYELGLVAAGTIRRFSGDLEDARSYAEQGVELIRRGGVRWWEGEALRALGQFSLQQGRLDEGVVLAGAASRVREAVAFSGAPPADAAATEPGRRHL